jgi:hypothetical protein
MKPASHWSCAAITLTVALSVASPPARSEECDDIIAALKKHADGIPLSDTQSHIAFCTSVGRLHGIMVAVREIARQCLDEGRKRDAAMKDVKEGLSAMQKLVDTKCN